MKTALLVIDAQVGLLEGERPIDRAEETLQVIQGLLQRAREAQVPVFYIRDDDVGEPGTPEGEIHPVVAPQAGEQVIRKKATDSFHGTDLLAALQQQGIERLVVAGFKTEYCVDTTCRRATTSGFRVILVRDGHSTTDNNVLTAAQIVAHHNCNLHGLDNVEHYIEVLGSEEIDFQQLTTTHTL